MIKASSAIFVIKTWMAVKAWGQGYPQDGQSSVQETTRDSGLCIHVGVIHCDTLTGVCVCKMAADKPPLVCGFV